MVGDSKARAAPVIATVTRMRWLVVAPNAVASASAVTADASANWLMRTIVRRSKRSATWPVMRNSSTAGANWTRPTRPRLSGLLVSSYICQPTATVCICSARLAHSRAHQNNTKGR